MVIGFAPLRKTAVVILTASQCSNAFTANSTTSCSTYLCDVELFGGQGLRALHVGLQSNQAVAKETQLPESNSRL